MKELFTERLRLRRLREDDAERIFSGWASDPEVTKFLTWQPHRTIGDTRAVLDTWLAEYERQDCFRYGIERKSDGQLMGMIDVVGFHHGNPVIGYCLGKGYWGKGYMTEALRAVTDELFEHGYDTIVIEAAEENTGSNRVIRKNGFQLVASRREKISQYNQRVVVTNSYRLYRKPQKLKIALLQLLPEGNLEGQMNKGMDACRQAKAMGADIALFPEMWSDGYEIPQDADRLAALTVPADGGFVNAFGRLAAELDMAVAITFLEDFKPQPRNSVVLFDRHGERRLHYAKVHTCDFGDEGMLAAGEDFYVADLDTAGGIVKVGCMICYDREFPESARILMLKGAEVMLVPNACPMEINRLSQLRARAYENMAAVATCSYPEGKPDCNGHSTVFDGIAYDCDRAGSRDMKVLEAPETEGIYMAEIDMDKLRRFRSREVHGNAYRRPDRYGLLVSKEKREPFIRGDYRPEKQQSAEDMTAATNGTFEAVR